MSLGALGMQLQLLRWGIIVDTLDNSLNSEVNERNTDLRQEAAQDQGDQLQQQHEAWKG